MEAAGGVHSGQEPLTSTLGEGAPPQETRKRRRSWTAEEDALLVADVRANGVGKWDAVPKRTGLTRTGPSCRFRWLNRLRPGLKDGVAFSPDEVLHLCRLHAAFGNKWARIAAEIEGRSENEVMYYWLCYVSRCQQAGVHVYPPEVQQAASAAGQYGLHQPRLKRHKSQSTTSLPQQPPVVLTYLPQPLSAVNPLTIAIAPRPLPHLPVMAEASSASQFWASVLSLANQNVEQGMQGDTTEFSENEQTSASLMALLNQNAEQEMQPDPPALPLVNATKFNEEDQHLLLLLPQSTLDVEQGSQPQPPALSMQNATEFNEEGQPSPSFPPLSNQNVEQERQPQSPELPMENVTEFNVEGQPSPSFPLLSHQIVEQERQLQSPELPMKNATKFNLQGQPSPSFLPLSHQNVEQERHPQSPALPLENPTELNEEGHPLASLQPQSDQNVEQGMQTQFGYATELFEDEFWCFG